MQKNIKLELLEDLLLSNLLITEKNIKKKVFIETIIYNEIFQTVSMYNKYIILNEFELLKSIKQLIILLEIKTKLNYNLIIIFEDDSNYDIFKYYYKNIIFYLYKYRQVLRGASLENLDDDDEA